MTKGTQTRAANPPPMRRSARMRWYAPLPAAVLVAVAASVGLGRSPAPANAEPQSHDCGGHERWRVKTLTDPAARSVNFTPRRTTVDALRALPVPGPIGAKTPRIQGVETTVYKIRVTLVEGRLVPDKDIHLVIRDEHRRHTMIVEFPDVRCQPAARSIKKTAMRQAREALLTSCGHIPTTFVFLRGTATMTGVGFFDKKHGQKGIAPNGIELHPVLSFTRATCERERSLGRYASGDNRSRVPSTVG
jgi:hypothetical protein